MSPKHPTAPQRCSATHTTTGTRIEASSMSKLAQALKAPYGSLRAIKSLGRDTYKDWRVNFGG